MKRPTFSKAIVFANDCYVFHFYIVVFTKRLFLKNVKRPMPMCEGDREWVQRRHEPRKNDLRAFRFAELPPGHEKPYLSLRASSILSLRFAWLIAPLHPLPRECW